MKINSPTKQRWLHLPGMPQKKRAKSPDTDGGETVVSELRLPFLGFMPNKVRNHFIATVAEFTGTFFFLFCAFAATQIANVALVGIQADNEKMSKYPNTNTLIYIALAFGFSLAVNAWAFFRISGGLFNPAVTLALCLVGAVGWIRGLIVAIAQILGAIAAAAVVYVLFPGPLMVTTELSGGASAVQGLFIETLLTAQFVFTIIMLAAEKHKGTFLAPIGIGLSLFISELTGVYFTGGSLNPARSFGPCVVLHRFPGYHWIYWVGPLLGAIIASIFYHLVKTLEYETANPGQDFNELEMNRFAFDEENATSGADVQRPDLSAPPADQVTISGGRERSTSTRVWSQSRSVRSMNSHIGEGAMDHTVHQTLPTDRHQYLAHPEGARLGSPTSSMGSPTLHVPRADHHRQTN